jgi:hypothetical protein
MRVIGGLSENRIVELVSDWRPMAPYMSHGTVHLLMCSTYKPVSSHLRTRLAQVPDIILGKRFWRAETLPLFRWPIGRKCLRRDRND